MGVIMEEEREGNVLSFSWVSVSWCSLLPGATLNVQLNVPLVPRARLVGADINMAQAKDKLIVLESHTASHTGTGIGPPIRCTHWNEAVGTTTGKTWRRTGEGREGGGNYYDRGKHSCHRFCNGMNTWERIVVPGNLVFIIQVTWLVFVALVTGSVGISSRINVDEQGSSEWVLCMI